MLFLHVLQLRGSLDALLKITFTMSKKGKEEVSDISPVLFLDTSGQSMRFYVRPGPTKTQLYPLVTNGGGTLCRNQEPGAILLIDPVDATTVKANPGQKYISTKYIRDCVEQNLQLNLDDYVISVGPSVQTRMATRHQSNGRLGYSPEDDAAILKFMEKRQHEAKGNRVWKEMEKRRVTGHSWQSMRDRFLKHLQNRLMKKSPTKRKPLCFTQSPLRKKKVTENLDPESDTLQNSPQKSVVVSDSSETQMASENSVCPAVRTDPQSSPERASSPPDVTDAPGEPPQASNHDSQDESPVLVQEQETPEPEMSKRLGLDEGCDGQEVPDGSKEHSSPNKTRQSTGKTATPDSSKLGILAKAAREFEDSDVIDESEEGEDPFEAPIAKPSDAQESSASSATLNREPETQAELNQNDLQEAVCPFPSPEEERPGPSSRAVPVSSSHVFILDSESQDKHESQTREPPEGAPSKDLVEQVENLMTKTKKDLVEVTKALWKASGDLARAQVYLQDGYDQQVHGPVWTHLDDQILLVADPYELEQLQSKYGAEEVTRRREFLTAGVN
ncbi:telomeric repeat-binding factor 2-interacting protein 1 isoform X3 [Carassius gibelio]|uniref:telomeric repeat-binding factor 2-interacting protein 1 isoform X3 n=1 Tax=Carassius gibelio TaxID=101364 RepID=UPI002277BA3B|nr:telomeric repeat-binding factor 2-interacting protein 1 isoform X3 [Carassius gibelio]